jgi:hypothetical protein
LIWPAVLSGATVRVLRGVAGRRALQVALLLGGVFALGLLGGERAHAAESVPSVSAAEVTPSATDPATSSATSVTSAAASPAVEVTEAAVPAEPTATPDATSAPATRDAVRPIGEHVGRVTEDLADGLRDGSERVVDGIDEVGERLEDGLGEDLGDVREKVAPPPALPALPPLPDLPSLPKSLPATVADTPEPGPADEAPVDRRDAGTSTGTADDTAYGPGLPVAPAHSTWHRAQDHGSAPAAHAVGPTPLQQAPGGEPDGLLGSRAAADGGGSRYGDAHAVTLIHRAPPMLVPGAAACVDAAEIRGRHRDIPVSPA